MINNVMKLVKGTLLGSLTTFAAAMPAFAIDLCPQSAPGQTSPQFSPLCLLRADQTGGLLGSLITLIFIVAIIIALFFLIWGGIKWLLSGGDKSAVEGARNHIIAAIVGLVIIFLSYFILNFVGGLFIQDFSLQNLQLPRLTPQ